MRASRRLINTVAVAGMAASAVGVAAQPAVAVAKQYQGCYANAGPDTGPYLSGGRVYGWGKGRCDPVYPFVTFTRAETLFEVQHNATDPWIYGGALVNNHNENVQVSLSIPCISGTWSYKVTTETYGLTQTGQEVEKVRVSTPVTRFSCK